MASSRRRERTKQHLKVQPGAVTVGSRAVVRACRIEEWSVREILRSRRRWSAASRRGVRVQLALRRRPKQREESGKTSWRTRAEEETEKLRIRSGVDSVAVRALQVEYARCRRKEKKVRSSKREIGMSGAQAKCEVK